MDLPIPSPFAEHLQTNYRPSDSEIREIRKLVDTPHPEISALDAEIARVSEQLKQLQSKRNAYDKYLASHRSLLSPIRRLPLEILQNIFSHCLPTEHNCLMSPHEAPMLLTHVCRQWRELVHGIPLLWSSLYIPIPNYPPIASCVSGLGYSRSTRDEFPLTEEQKEVVEEVLATWDRKIAQRKEIVKEWLARAQGSNLSITFTQWDVRKEPGPSHSNGQGTANPDSAKRVEVQEIVALIKSYSKQWERLEICASRCIVEELVSVPAEEAPNLEFLWVSSRPVVVLSTAMAAQLGVQGTVPSELPSLFPEGSVVTSPRLKVLSFRAIQQDITQVPTRWENLTGLFFYGYAQHGVPSINSPQSFTPTQALDLLALCPNLKQCGLVVGSHPWSMPGPHGMSNLVNAMDEPRHIVLPHLEQLYIQEHPSHPLAQFFQCLEMPKLVSLKFSTSIAPTKLIDHPEEDSQGPGALPGNLAPLMAQSLFPQSDSTQPPTESSLLTLLQNCGYNLKRLEFDYHSQTQDDLRRCLQLADNVERLSLKVINPSGGLGTRTSMYYINHREREHAPAFLGNAFFRELIPKLGEEDVDTDEGSQTMRDPGCLCPNLTHFFVKLTTAEFSEESLLEFVRARRHVTAPRMGVARLKKVKVIFATDSKKKTRKERQKEEKEKLGKEIAAAGDEKSINDDDEPKGTDEDALARSIASFLCKKLKRTPPSWNALDTLKGQEGTVDLDGFEADVSFPGTEGRGFMLLPGRMGIDGMWSPRWGLQEEGKLPGSSPLLGVPLPMQLIPSY